MRLRMLVPILGLGLIVSGCGNGSVNSIKALTLEEVSGKRLASMSQDEKDGVMFKYLTNSVIVDNENLITIDSNDFKTIEGILKGVHETLKGNDAKKIDGSPYISDEFANYLLYEFTKTPYEWKHVSTTPIGYDASTRMYFIDVNYETADTLKYVIPTSSIPQGIPGESVIKEKRYSDYMAYISYAAKGDMANATPLFNDFVNNWGSIDKILEEQDTKTLIERVRAKKTKNIGGITYTGVIQDPQMTQPAKMTLRYILKYNYNLGEETTLGVEKVYLKSYELKDTKKYIDAENLILRPDGEPLKVLEPYVKQTINSYEKAVTERNHVGLYSLFENYAMFDKYYNALDSYTYSWSSPFTFRIIEKKGTDLKVVIEREKQYRGKNTYMSMPTYNEVILATMVMSDNDKIKFKNMYLLQSDLVGEPNSVIKNISGVSEQLTYSGQTFSDENKKKVEDVTKRFLQAVYNNDTVSGDFTDTVDIGVSQNTLMRIYENVTAIKDANSKVNYITWNSKSNSYVSLTVREIFLKADHNIDTESVIDLVNRNGNWYIINYTRTLSVKTKAGDVTNTKNILSENRPEGSIDREEIKNEVKGKGKGKKKAPKDIINEEQEEPIVEEPIREEPAEVDTPPSATGTEPDNTTQVQSPTTPPVDGQNDTNVTDESTYSFE